MNNALGLHVREGRMTCQGDPSRVNRYQHLLGDRLHFGQLLYHAFSKEIRFDQG